MRLRTILPAAAVAAAFALSACGGYGDSSAERAAPTAGAATQAPAPKTQLLQLAELDAFTEPVVVNRKGRTVYRFEAEPCQGDCLKTWEPVLAPNGFEVKGIEEDLVGVVTRPEGEQLTLNGRLLYYFKDDLSLGQIEGHGKGDVWFAITGTAAKAELAGAAGSADEGGDTAGGYDDSGSSNSGSGDDRYGSGNDGGTAAPAPASAPADKQTVTVTDVKGITPALHSKGGRVMYLFTKESNDPTTIACTGDCLTTWEPVLAPNGVSLLSDQLDPTKVDLTNRPDGLGPQVSYNGWALYYFKTDMTLGQIAGHGVGDVWFAIGPDGKQAQRTS